MDLIININLDGAAFDDMEEIRRLLAKAAEIIVHQNEDAGAYRPSYGLLIDSNGNAAGHVIIQERKVKK